MKLKAKAKTKKISGTLFLITVLALALTAASCSPDNPDNKETINTPLAETSDGDDGEIKNPAAENIKCPVPDDLDFGGQKVRFYNYYPEFDGNGNPDPARAAILDADTGDVVNDAIYKRNIEVQDKLNVTFEFIHSPPNADDSLNNNIISRSVNAGLDEYDIVIGRQFQCVQLTANKIFANIKDLPYLDINNPWWAKKYIEDISIGGDVLMFVTGDISLAWLVRLSTVYFNKDLYTRNFGSPDDMYNTVLDGGWTLDALNGMVKTMYGDLNGNGAADDEDQYGLIAHTISNTDHLTYASGIKATSRDENGLPYFSFNNEKTIRLTEKLYELYYNNTGSLIIPFSHSNFNNIFNEKFTAGEVLFRLDILGNSETLRSMQTDFGMIPYPKLDAREPSYLSLVHDTAPLMCIPQTCAQDELVGAVLEEMAFRGYLHMTPAFFDIALKNKYMRDSDDKAMQCLDLIRENSTTDFAYVYNYALNNMGLIMRDLMGKKSSDFVSAYEKIEDKANASLQKIIDTYIN